MTDPLFTVWATTEGLEWSPILCTTGSLAGRLVEDLSTCRAISSGALLPCCKNDPATACSRDQYDDDELNAPIEVLMRTAMHHGYTWPSDLGKTEPEYSVLP